VQVAGDIWAIVQMLRRDHPRWTRRSRRFRM